MYKTVHCGVGLLGAGVEKWQILKTHDLQKNSIGECDNTKKMVIVGWKINLYVGGGTTTESR